VEQDNSSIVVLEAGEADLEKAIISGEGNHCSFLYICAGSGGES
jgi:hypothetical protein